MTVETRKSLIQNSFKNWKLKNKVVVKNKNSFNNRDFNLYERDVLEVTKDWRTINCKEYKTYPFGSNRTNIWNHEWSEQFLTYSHNEWKESNSLTNNTSYWSEEVGDLISRDKDDFDSKEEYESRLNECLEISNKYN